MSGAVLKKTKVFSLRISEDCLHVVLLFSYKTSLFCVYKSQAVERLETHIIVKKHQ